MLLNTEIFWYIMLCLLVEIYRKLKGLYYIHFKDRAFGEKTFLRLIKTWRWRHYELWNIDKYLHIDKASVFIK
jgi:hypothetical protein